MWELFGGWLVLEIIKKMNKTMRDKYKQVILAVFCFLCFKICAQEDSEILIAGGNTSDMFFHLYEPPLEVKAIYKDTLQAVNEYPEQLMMSIISAKSQKWVDYNTLGGASKSDKKSGKHFEMVNKMDVEKNFFKLYHKLEFLVDGIPTVIIKFYIILEDSSKPTSGAIVMQKHNNRWYKTSTPFTSRLSLLIMRFRSDLLKKVLIGSRDEENLENLFDKMNDDGNINLDRLVNEFYNWYSPVKNDDMLNYFIDKNAW